MNGIDYLQSNGAITSTPNPGQASGRYGHHRRSFRSGGLIPITQPVVSNTGAALGQMAPNTSFQSSGYIVGPSGPALSAGRFGRRTGNKLWVAVMKQIIATPEGKAATKLEREEDIREGLYREAKAFAKDQEGMFDAAEELAHATFVHRKKRRAPPAPKKKGKAKAKASNTKKKTTTKKTGKKKS